MTLNEFKGLLADYGEGCADGSSLKWVNEARVAVENAFAALEAERDALRADAHDSENSGGRVADSAQAEPCDHDWISNKAYPLSDNAAEVCSRCWVGRHEISVHCPDCGHPFGVDAPAPVESPTANKQEARDANRYRWLRDKADIQEIIELYLGYSETLEEMDAMIDAAIAAKEPKV